jgi:ribonuclease T2
MFMGVCYGSLATSSNKGVYVLPHHVVYRALVLVFALAFTLLAGPAAGQDPQQNQPGKFDFYVLSLSWMPSFCDAAAERSPDRPLPAECGTGVYPFAVHGLWPQYTTGFPEFCQQPAPKLDYGVISSALGLMPAPRLISNEWERNGTCSGLSPGRSSRPRARRARW